MSGFQVIFEGKLTGEKPIEEVKANLAGLFKMNAKQADAMFAGKPIVIKRNIDESTAKKYQAALKKAGALCLVQNSTQNSDAVANTASKPQSSSPAKPATTASSDRTGRMAGKDIVFIDVPSDLGGISMAAAGEEIETLAGPPAAPIPDTSGLSMGMDDAPLSSKAPAPEPQLDISGLAIEDN